MYLDAFKSVLPIAQTQVIEAVLESMRQADLIRSDIEYEKEWDRIVKLISSSYSAATATKIPPEYQLRGQITHEFLNELFMSLYFDMNGIYSQTNIIDNTIGRHSTIDNGFWASVNAATRKLLQDITAYRFLKTHPGYSDYILNSFVDARNSALIRPAYITAGTTKMTLPVRENIPLHSKKGILPTKVSSTILSSGVSAISGGADVKYAIDPDRDTFWAELYMSDLPMATIYNSTTYNGMIAELVLEFPVGETFNTIRFLPFGIFEPEVIDIRYSDNGTDWLQLSNTSLPYRTLDWVEVNFPTITAKYIKLVIRQKSFDYVNYLIPKQMAQNSRIWEYIIDDKLLSRVVPNDLSDIDQKIREASREFNAFLDASAAVQDSLKWKDIDMDPIRQSSTMRTEADAIARYLASFDDESKELVLDLLPANKSKSELGLNDPEFIETTKFEYTLGMYSVEVLARAYEFEGYFESPKHLPSRNPITIEVDVDVAYPDEIPYPGSLSCKEVLRETSIEVDLEITGGRTKPIIPYGVDLIEDEFLKINPVTKKGQTRFVPNLGVPI